MRVNINWSYIVFGYLSLFVMGFMDNTRGPYFPNIIADLVLSDTEASLFFAVASFMAVVSGRMVPWLVHRLSLVNVMRGGHSLLAVGCLGFSESQNLGHLILATVIFGYGFGLINVGQNLLILEGSPLKKRRQMLSGLHSVYALASLLAPLLIRFLTDVQWTWRQGFQMAAAICGVGLISSFWAEKDDEESGRTLPVARIVPWREWLPFGAALSFYIAAELAISTRLVLYLRRELAVDESAATATLAAFFALLLVGRLVFTFFSFQNWGNRNILLAGFLLSALFFTLGLSYSHWFLVGAGLVMAPCFGVSVDYMAEVFGRSADRVVAMVLAISGLFIVGMHFLIGFLTDTYGIHTALYAGPVMLVLSFLIFKTKTSMAPSGTN